MKPYDYIYEFSDITDKGSAVRMVIPKTNKSHNLQVYIKDSDFLWHRQCPSFPDILADIVDLSVSVSLADWLSKHLNKNSHKIKLILPVRHPEVLSSTQSIDLLESTLFWYTGDHWEFGFTKRIKCARNSERQLHLSECSSPEVALWSGGLDALAGLYNRISASTNDNFTLFGTGSSKYTLGIQKKVYNEATSHFGTFIKLVQLPFFINKARNIRKNESLRARGFSFLLLGVVCACLENQDTLYVYENGIGAINLPFRASEVGLDHSRSVHPISLLKIAELASFWLGKPFALHNPFLFHTKGEMCKTFNQQRVRDIIPKTVSCDSKTRRKGYKIQCGYCSSCLLRRQSLVAAGVEDETEYVITHSRSSKPKDRVHFRAMQLQVDKLRIILNSDKPWYRLTKEYPILMDIVDRCLEEDGHNCGSSKILQLYDNYVKEWDLAKETVGKEILMETIV